MKTHDALALANWFLARAKAEGKTLDPMKLQKLIYFAHGWALALTDIPLITEHPEAWDYGPVIPSVTTNLNHLVGTRLPSAQHNSPWTTQTLRL